MRDITLTVTGLRSHKLFGKDYNQSNYIGMVNFTTQFLTLNPFIKEVNIGMATGSDLMFGLGAIRYRAMSGGDLIINCFVPGDNQTEYYSAKEKEIYDYILSKADSIVVTSQGPCTPDALKSRNKKMIKKTDWVLAFWNYHKAKSGTWNTINQAIKKDKTVYCVNPFNMGMREFYHVSEEDKEHIERLQKHYTINQ